MFPFPPFYPFYHPLILAGWGMPRSLIQRDQMSADRGRMTQEYCAPMGVLRHFCPVQRLADASPMDSVGWLGGDRDEFEVGLVECHWGPLACWMLSLGHRVLRHGRAGRAFLEV